MIIINRGAQLSMDTRKKGKRERETSNRGVPFPRNNAHNAVEHAERKKSARRYESKFLQRASTPMMHLLVNVEITRVGQYFVIINP